LNAFLAMPAPAEVMVALKQSMRLGSTGPLRDMPESSKPGMPSQALQLAEEQKRRLVLNLVRPFCTGSHCKAGCVEAGSMHPVEQQC
jgi:hypothetical protein